jgi:ADP-heptose:LPS heptosyltransferase
VGHERRRGVARGGAPLSAPLGPVERIAVVRALPGLGDLLCLTPALRALRAAFPAAHVALVGLPNAALLLERLGSYVDELLPFPGFPGLPEVPFDQDRLDGFVAQAHERHFDLALQLHGNGPQSSAFTALLGARVTAGYGPEAPFLPPADDLPEVRRPLRVLAHLGIPDRGDAVELPLTDDDERAAASLVPPAPYAVLHPGAADPARRWPPQRFAAVADALAERGLVPVVTGTEGERATVARVRRLAEAQTLDLTARTSLGALGVLLRDARITVTNDTGTSHVAAAVGARSVVVFRASDPARWAPLDRTRHRALPDPEPRPQPGDAVPPLADVGVGDAVRAIDALLA